MFLPTLWAPADWHGMAWHKEMRLGPGQFFGMRGLSFCSAEVWAVVSSDSGLIRKCPIDFLAYYLLQFVAYIFCPNDTRDREEVGIDSSGNAVVIKRRQRCQCWLICEKPLA